MKRKIIYGIVGGVILLVIGFFLGAFIGMYIGGNYLPAFEFAGGVGPEALGNIGGIVGAAIGALFGVLIGVKLADNKSPLVYGKYFVIILVLLITTMLFLHSNSPDEQVTFEQAQIEADFTIYEPTYLPEDVELGTVVWTDVAIKSALYSGYVKENQTVFDLTQSKLTKLMLDPNSVEVDISGTTGYLFKHGNATYLTWYQNDSELTISTEVLSEEEILKIARSIK